MASHAHAASHARTHARTHDTNTKQNQNQFPGWGSTALIIPPNLRYIHTYKTTLRVIRRLCGGGWGSWKHGLCLGIGWPHQSTVTSMVKWSAIAIVCWDQLLRWSAEISCWDYLLRSAVEILCWGQLLRLSVEINCWDYQLRLSVEFSCWNSMSRSAVEIFC